MASYYTSKYSGEEIDEILSSVNGDESGSSGGGKGDMEKFVYDPEGKNQDIFAYADTKIPRVATVTLLSTGWSNLRQTITVTGILNDEKKQFIQATPSTASLEEYYQSKVLLVDQSVNSLTFSCVESPSSNLTVYIVISEVRS